LVFLCYLRFIFSLTRRPNEAESTGEFFSDRYLLFLLSPLGKYFFQDLPTGNRYPNLRSPDVPEAGNRVNKISLLNKLEMEVHHGSGEDGNP
jgi:hypothetical protein